MASALLRQLAAGIPSRFKFEESIGQNPALPRSDYYRAQHMLNALWSQVGPKYFPNRPQPTLDPQIVSRGKDPLSPRAPRLGSDWTGLTYPRRSGGLYKSSALTPRLRTPGGQLPQPGVYGLDNPTLQNLAHPSYYADPLPQELTSVNPITHLMTHLPVVPPKLVFDKTVYPSTMGQGDVRLPANSRQDIVDPALTAIHEWAHNFQGPTAWTSPMLAEGGAEDFAQRVTPGVMNRLGLPTRGSGYVAYPSFVKQLRRLSDPRDWATYTQFRY